MPSIFNINAALLTNRITTAERSGIPAATLSTGGGIIYNTDTEQFQLWQNSAWLSIPTSGIGSVNGPVSSVVGDIATWNNTTGTLLADSGASILTVSGVKQLGGIGNIYIASTTVPSAPATANDGIYLVNTGKPVFKSGTLGYSGTLITGLMNAALNNILINFNSPVSPPTGDYNTSQGTQSGASITTGGYNSLYGALSGEAITTSSYNTCVGALAGEAIWTGSGRNVCVGYSSGVSLVTGDNCVLIGANADCGTSLTNATAIGALATVSASNCLVLGNNANIGIGISNPSFQLHIAGPRSTKSIVVTGVQNGGGTDNIGFLNDIVLTSTSATTTALHQWIYPNFNATGGTISSAAGLLIDTGGNTGGTISSGYGLYVHNPAFGTTKCAIYGANISIGYTSVTPPANSLIVSGNIGIGLSGPSYPLHIGGTRTTAYSAYITGTHNSSNFLTTGLYINETITPSTGIDYGAHQLIIPNFDATSGSITSIAAGLYIDSGSNTGGTITNGYGIFVDNPAFGTNKCAIFARNASIGFAGATPPSTGMIVSGNLGVGTFSPSSKLHVVGNAGSLAVYGMMTIESDITNGSGLSFGYDTGNNWSYIYSRTVAIADRALNINNLLYVGPAGAGALSLGLSTFTTGKFVTAYDILPSTNKAKDIGSAALRFNNVYYASATTGTSRLAPSRTHCHLCDKAMMRGTGTTIILGEEADYIPVFCLDCGDQKVEALKHLPIEALSKRKAPTKNQFLGFKVCQYSGNSRGIQVMFKYDDDKENSTYLSDVEYDAFIIMDKATQKAYLEELGLREWNALEEVRLMEAECILLQNKLDMIAKDFVVNEDIDPYSLTINKDLYNENTITNNQFNQSSRL